MSEFDCIIQIETVKNVQTIKGGERMLLEERLDEIVKIVNERGSISNQELVKMLRLFRLLLERFQVGKDALRFL